MVAHDGLSQNRQVPSVLALIDCHIATELSQYFVTVPHTLFEGPPQHPPPYLGPRKGPPKLATVLVGNLLSISFLFGWL
jgi:hypothetical protein